MKFLKQGTLIEIEWKDIVSVATQWEPLSEAEKFDWRPWNCKTVGYVIEDTKSHLAICSSLGADKDQFANVWSFPKGCVVKIRKLK